MGRRQMADLVAGGGGASLVTDSLESRLELTWQSAGND